MVDANNGAGYPVDDLVDMRVRHERKHEQFDRIAASIIAYVGDRYDADDKVLFEQVDLNGPSVESMFVDVPFTCRADAPVAAIMGQIAAEHPGDQEASREAGGLPVTGAAQALLHPAWTSNALLVGGPGQGKSTLLQFICQFYRARLLSKENYLHVATKLGAVTEMERIPLRLDLRKYAAWASKELKGKKKPKQHASASKPHRNLAPIEQYLLSEIQVSNGGLSFTRKDLAVMLTSRLVLLALDGLDEVADPKMREDVSNEIVAMNARLQANAFNLTVLVATRPGAATARLWSSSEFPQLRLRRLSQGLRLQYLQHWAVVAGLKPDQSTELQRTFLENQHVAHLRELAAYPMQLAILLHLLQRRRLLPQQRTELYDDYIKTFLDREQAEDKEPLLADQRRLIEDIHAYVGWHIQTQAETGKSSGAIKRDDLRELLRSHLADHDGGPELADKLFGALTSRVL